MTDAAPGLLTAFGAGLLSFLSPCVLPLVPGYLSLMSGLSVADLDEGTATHRRSVLATAALFVLGFSLVFVAYGAIASGLGQLLLRHRVGLTRASGVVVVLMGLVVAGVLRPAALLRDTRFHVSPARFGPLAAPVMGVAFAFGWTPCIGPVLAVVLTLAAGRETLSDGVTLLGAYSLGLGAPFLLAGVSFAGLRRTQATLLRFGPVVDALSGALLITLGVLLLTNQLGRVSSAVTAFWQWIGLDGLTLG